MSEVKRRKAVKKKPRYELNCDSMKSRIRPPKRAVLFKLFILPVLARGPGHPDNEEESECWDMAVKQVVEWAEWADYCDKPNVTTSEGPENE